MTTFDNKNKTLKWLVYLFDVITYILVIEAIVLMAPKFVPIALLHHTDLAEALGVLCFVVFSFIFPTVIHLRIISVQKVIVRNALVALSSQMLFIALWHVMTVESQNEKVFFLISTIGVFLALMLVRFLESCVLNYVRLKGHNLRNIVFVGSDPANLLVYEEMIKDPTTGHNVLGYYSNDEIEDAPETFKKLGTRSDLAEIIDGNKSFDKHVDELYCSLSHDDKDEMRRLIRYCDKEVVHFYYVPRIFQNLQMSLKPEIIGNNVVFTNHYEPLAEAGNRMVKRTFDIFFSLVVLILLLPITIVVYFIIKKQSPGPIFFKQERTGMNGQNFFCYKFRSMHVNADADKVQATKDDPRKFPFGNFMRKYNIDELPQFLNVLKGDMSIVGPRPHMTLHTEQYSALIDKYMVRHFAKPGITGLAQVTGFRGETEQLWQMEGRIKKDIYYIENWTFWLDIKICFLTALSMVYHDKNAY